jgi:hypothetical protein
MRAANIWTESILPNSTLAAPNLVQLPADRKTNRIQSLFEMPLRGGGGARLEQWAMKFQLQRMEQRSGAGDETVFSADICQANFHHHRRGTREMFQQRLKNLGADPALPFALSGAPAKTKRGERSGVTAA